jgi:hypothetical protein
MIRPSKIIHLRPVRETLLVGTNEIQTIGGGQHLLASTSGDPAPAVQHARVTYEDYDLHSSYGSHLKGITYQ